ncbi:alpha/beta fold hydrolase [Nocardioides sp. Bht2]|uniref:alpha/beta fold hydrolase n=1 Tax=Nocardioides sp. Bht2 TaxID=3392297 RepID=UPI0039B49E12
MRRITVAPGIDVAVHEQGTGIPVLLAHAWGETHRSFDRLVPLLPRTMRLVLPDQRGVGVSSRPAAGYSLEQLANDLVAVLDALEIERCWLLGTSSGGYVAQQLAVTHPERVLGLILVGAPADLREVDAGGLVELLAGLDDPLTGTDVATLQGAFTFHSPVPKAFLKDQRTAVTGIPRHVWLDSFNGLIAATPPLEVGTITAPTLILWGADDDVLPREQAAFLHAAIAGSRFVTYPDTGHLVLWEQPTLVAGDSLDFISSHTGD